MTTTFKKGDEIIPLDGKYPEDAFHVVEHPIIPTQGIAPLHGGFVRALKDPAAWRLVTERDKVPTWRKVFVGFDDGPEWPAWTDGQLWNGWARPHFEKHVAEMVLEYLSDAYAWKFDEKDDAFIVTDTTDQGCGGLKLSGHGIPMPDGTVVRVYDFSDGGWTFNSRELCSAVYASTDVCGWCYVKFDADTLSVDPETCVLRCDGCAP